MVALCPALAVGLSLQADSTMAYPEWSVEFAPGIDASTFPDSGDWEDVSGYVSAWSVKWGRESELDQPGAGTATVALDNAEGTWDPDNASGTYYGDLKAGAWFRILAGPTSADNDVFYGHVSIDGFPVNTTQFPDSTVTVQLVDDLEMLANSELPGSVYEIEVEADGPRAWWRQGESSGTTMVDSSGNEYHGTYSGGVTFNSRAGLVANQDDNALEYDGVDDWALVEQPAAITDDTFSVEVWYSAPTPSVTGTIAMQGTAQFGSAGLESVDRPGSQRGWWLGIENDPLGGSGITLAFMVGDGATVRHVRAALPTADATHHVVATYSAGTTHLYVNGNDESLTTVAGGSPTPTAGQIRVGTEAFGVMFFAGTLDEIAIYDSALSGARVAAHYTAGTEPWGSETSGNRADNLLDAVGFHSERNIATGNTTLQVAELAGGDAQSALLEVAAAERGLLYVDHTAGGTLRLVDRRYRWEATASIASQATFGDSGSEVTYDAVGLSDDRIINRASVQRANGSAVVVVDSASVAEYGLRSFSESGLLLEDDTEAQSRAELIVAEKNERRRVPRSVTLRPRWSTHSAWPQVFERTVNDRVTVKWRPPYGGGTAYTFTAWIDGIAHDWTKDGLSTTFYLAPVPHDSTDTVTAYWIAGVSRAGVDTRPGY